MAEEQLDSLPTRLRQRAEWLESRSFAHFEAQIEREAADQIERLAAELDEEEKLRTRIDALEATERALRQVIASMKVEDEDQLRTQLAGCLAAAEGATTDVAKQGDYGWSPAYQAVLDLRRRRDHLARQMDACLDATQDIHRYVYTQGDYDWSPAYQAILELRRKCDVINRQMQAGATFESLCAKVTELELERDELQRQHDRDKSVLRGIVDTGVELAKAQDDLRCAKQLIRKYEEQRTHLHELPYVAHLTRENVALRKRLKNMRTAFKNLTAHLGKRLYFSLLAQMNSPTGKSARREVHE